MEPDLQYERNVGFALLMLMMFVVLATLGCYATTESPSPNCNPVMVQCNPADYPPLSAMLPKSPILPPMEAPLPEPQTADTPASNLLKKLGK